MSTQPSPPGDLQDPQLARWYRDGGGAEPSPELDQAILAIAHREVQARPHAVGSIVRRWRVPLALAAVVVLSVTVVTLVTEHGGELADLGAPARPDQGAVPAPGAARVGPQKSEGGTPPAGAERERVAPAAVAELRPDAPVPAVPGAKVRPSPREQGGGEVTRERAAVPEPFRDTVPESAGERERRAAGSRFAGPRRTEEQKAEVKPGGQEDPQLAASPRDHTVGGPPTVAKAAQPPERGPVAPQAAAPVPTPQQASPPVAAPLGSQAEDRAVAEQRSIARPRAAATAMPPSGKIAPLLKALDDQPPERWLEKIGELRRAGRDAEADELLVAFKKRFPEHAGAAAR